MHRIIYQCIGCLKVGKLLDISKSGCTTAWLENFMLIQVARSDSTDVISDDVPTFCTLNVLILKSAKISDVSNQTCMLPYLPCWLCQYFSHCCWNTEERKLNHQNHVRLISFKHNSKLNLRHACTCPGMFK